jgi:hypothetical protein
MAQTVHEGVSGAYGERAEETILPPVSWGAL